MDTPPDEDNPVIESVGMEDSLFPFISDSYNHFLKSHSLTPNNKKSLPIDQQSDLEADSMPESQMELTEVDVYTQLEHKERDLILAAELGKSLLEKNEELSRENERLQLELHESVDALEQEKHELKRKLDCKTSECEVASMQQHHDVKRLQDQLEEQKSMLAAVEREKSRAVQEISEQNHKLLSQLQRASEAETQLSSQVQQLRKEFLERTSSTSVRLLQLESQKEEIDRGSKVREQLESHYDAMKDESALLRDELASANEKVHLLERHLHEKERELKRMSLELNDSHLTNRQLQVRVDELREEITLHASYASHGNSSLLAELEQSGVDCFDVVPSTMRPTDLTSSTHDVDQLKQEMWETYQRVQSLCTMLRTFINKANPTGPHGADASQEEPPHSLHSINLSSALAVLSELVQEAFQAKESKNIESDFTIKLKEKQTKLILERDEAVTAKNALEVNLAKAKVDLMAVNSQLLEAIQQKLQQQKELEAWQDDMELMIQKALNERNEMNRTNALLSQRAANQEPASPKSSWFSFSRRSRQVTDQASPSPGLKSSPNLDQSRDTDQKPGLFTSWLKRKPQPTNDQPITDENPDS